MSITEYNKERHMKMVRMEGIEIGLKLAEQIMQEGKYNVKIDVAINMLIDGSVNHEKIAKLTELPIEKVEELAKLMA